MPRGEGRRAARAGRSAPERNRIVAARGARNSGTPQTSAERCIDCPVEHDCPYSAVDLYCTRRDWISNFDVPQGRTLDESAGAYDKTGAKIKPCLLDIKALLRFCHVHALEV